MPDIPQGWSAPDGTMPASLETVPLPTTPRPTPQRTFALAKNAFHWLWSNTDAITKWLQVVALLFAAIWTYLIFKDSQAPSLETGPAISNDLTFSNWRAQPAPGWCQINVAVTINNVGVKAFDVGGVRLRIWHQELKLAPGMNFIDLHTIEGHTPLFDQSPITTLTDHFPPKKNIHQGFNWLYSGEAPTGWYIFGASVMDKKGKQLGSADSWTGQLCNPQ